MKKFWKPRYVPIIILAFLGFAIALSSSWKLFTRPEADTTVVSDTFSRSATGSWSSADNGGSYSLKGQSSDFNVDGSVGTIVAPTASSARAAILGGVKQTNNDITFQVKTNKTSEGAAQEVFFIARQIDENNLYRGKIRLTIANTVTVQIAKVVNGAETLIANPVTIPNLNYSPNTYLDVHTRLTGTSPTTIDVKVWPDGTTEPEAWSYSITDSEGVLQAAGSPGLRVNLPAPLTNAPILFSFDNFSVTTSDVTPTQPPSGNPITYYVDCNTGADGNTGTSMASAWKTVSKVNGATLQPGDSLFFKRGCTWTNPDTAGDNLKLSWNGSANSPITIGAYGGGNSPIIQSDARGVRGDHINVLVTGSYLTIRDLHSSLINPYREPSCVQSDGTGVRLGWYVGFSISGHHNILNNVEADALSVGINLTDGANSNKLLNSYIHDLNALWRIDRNLNALGALGVNLHGDDNEAGYNLFEKNGAQCNYVDTGQDQNYSAPFEIYNANRSYVHHNRAYEHRKHYEMGKATVRTSTGNVLAYNLFVSSKALAKGPNIHGSANQFGPINNTQIYNNTLVFTGAGSEALICSCDGGAIVKNNIFIAENKAAYYSGNFTESNNLYWDYQKTVDNPADPLVQIVSGPQLSTTSLKLNPMFLDPDVPNGNFHLSSTSPAINRGAAIIVSDPRLITILQADLDNAQALSAGGYEMGSYTYNVTTSSPTASPTITSSPTASPTQTASPTVAPTTTPTFNPTATPTIEPTFVPTPIPPISDGGGGSGGGSGGGGSCTTPTGAPWLYGAVSKKPNIVELYFTNASEPFDNYQIAYGTKSNSYQFGTVAPKGLIPIVIRFLSPNVTYYFRIRASNGCGVGPWSNELSTRSRWNSVSRIIKAVLPTRRVLSSSTVNTRQAAPATTVGSSGFGNLLQRIFSR